MAFTTKNLTNNGATAHYQFQYDDSLAKPGGPEPARTNAVIAACEADFNLMSGWFGNIALNVNTPISVNVTQNSGGGVGSLSNGNLTLTLNPGKGDDSLVRYLMVAEIVEVFMRAQGLGWFGSRNEGSEGEGLSRFLAAQFLALNGFGDPPARFQISNDWLKSARGDFVNKPDPTDAMPDEKTGCALLFIWYLFSQLGFSINAIVAAGASPLSAVYQKLMGDPSDPFPLFKALLDKVLPGTKTITSGNRDNPFPVRFDGILLQVRGKGPVWVIYGNGRFQVPDDATRSRLFPGALVFPYGDFLFAINTIPDEGTLLREESSSQVWIIQNRTRALAPLHPFGTVHVLWDGALAQIPLTRSILAGLVTDMQQAPLSDVSVLITSTSVIPSAGGNTEQLSTDSHGQYSSSFLPPGTYSVSASQDGFVPQLKSAAVREGVPSTPLNFQLERTVPFTLTGTVKGRIGDNTTVPIVATVRLTKNSPVPGIITTKTNSGGHYSITMDPGPYSGDYTIDFTALGFASQSVTITILNGENPVVDFILDKQGILTGHVTAGQNLPLGGASVSLGGPQTFTDVTGLYSIMVDPGPYTATVTLTGFRADVAPVTIPVGGTLVHDVLLARAMLGSITGTVSDDSGTALDATVAIPGASTRTMVNGSFTVANVPPGTYQATASAGRHYTTDTETVTVNEGQTAVVNFVLTLKSIRLVSILDAAPELFNRQGRRIPSQSLQEPKKNESGSRRIASSKLPH